jgi:hypothetical protein
MDEVAGLAVDTDGGAYITGARASSPNVYPADKPYLIKLAPDGRTVYDLQLPSFVRPAAVGLDAQGGVYIAGFASGAAHETNGLGLGLTDSENGVVLKLDGESQELRYLSLFGGAAYDRIEDLAVDADGRAYVAGVTESADLPVTLPFASGLPGADRDVFVAAVSPAGDELEWVATFGGPDRESDARVDLTADGRIVVTGSSGSADTWFAAIDAADQRWLAGDNLGIAGIRDVASGANGAVFLAGTRIIAQLNPDFSRDEDLAAGALRIAAGPEGNLVGAGDSMQGVCPWPSRPTESRRTFSP